MKCKDCECHDNLKTKGVGFDGDHRGRGHWCMASVTVQNPLNIMAVLSYEKPMTYRESSQTPDWCPKVNDTVDWRGEQCKVLKVKR